mmetsp:Transcript_139054/g.266699  ORF Transcript_139054/g.266699 Transcript_139054/m.266699 type:complete len:211 (+) Transcript_139054:1059-1691(+)
MSADKRSLGLCVPLGSIVLKAFREIIITNTHRNLTNTHVYLCKHDLVIRLCLLVNSGSLGAKGMCHLHFLTLVGLLAKSSMSCAQVPNVKPSCLNATHLLDFDTFLRILDAIFAVVLSCVSPSKVAIQDIKELPAFLWLEGYDAFHFPQHVKRFIMSLLFHSNCAHLVQAFDQPCTSTLTAERQYSCDQSISLVNLVVLQIGTHKVYCNT